MIYEHFRATGGHEAAHVLSDLFNRRFQNDDVQDLDTRWDQALLAASETPTANGPGGFVQVNIAGFCSASDCIGYVRTRENSRQRTTKLFQIEDNSETSHCSDNEDAKQ